MAGEGTLSVYGERFYGCVITMDPERAAEESKADAIRRFEEIIYERGYNSLSFEHECSPLYCARTGRSLVGRMHEFQGVLQQV